MYAFMVECWHEVIITVMRRVLKVMMEIMVRMKVMLVTMIIISQNSRFSTSGANSSTCLPRDSPKTAPVGGFGGKVMIMIIISVRMVWDECEMT